MKSYHHYEADGRNQHVRSEDVTDLASRLPLETCIAGHAAEGDGILQRYLIEERQVGHFRKVGHRKAQVEQIQGLHHRQNVEQYGLRLHSAHIRRGCSKLNSCKTCDHPCPGSCPRACNRRSDRPTYRCGDSSCNYGDDRCGCGDGRCRRLARALYRPNPGWMLELVLEDIISG